jgi:hypothetical protein
MATSAATGSPPGPRIGAATQHTPGTISCRSQRLDLTLNAGDGHGTALADHTDPDRGAGRPGQLADRAPA